MKNEIYDSMLSRYALTTEQNKRNAIFEVNQQVILAGLYSGGFFDSVAFYGGTCLRFFHGLQRFREDMDFSLLAQDDTFDFSKFGYEYQLGCWVYKNGEQYPSCEMQRGI